MHVHSQLLHSTRVVCGASSHPTRMRPSHARGSVPRGQSTAVARLLPALLLFTPLGAKPHQISRIMIDYIKYRPPHPGACPAPSPWLLPLPSRSRSCALSPSPPPPSAHTKAMQGSAIQSRARPGGIGVDNQNVAAGHGRGGHAGEDRGRALHVEE